MSTTRKSSMSTQHSIPQEDTENTPMLRKHSSSTVGPNHHEKHAKHSEYMRDAIIGFADGLTVPFALTAGLSAVGSIRVVIVGGLAELFAGAISMGLGAWLAAETERKHYLVEEARERREVRDMPEAEEEEIFEIFDEYHVSREAVRPIVDALRVNEDMWVKFMMDFELKLECPQRSKSWISAIVMGLSYFIGGLIPMIPYFIYSEIQHAFMTSIVITIIILLIFGYMKATVTGCTRRESTISAIQTLLVGALAAATSYGIVRAVNERLGD